MYAIEKKHDGYHVYGNGMFKRVYQSEGDAREWVDRMITWMESASRIRRHKSSIDTKQK